MYKITKIDGKGLGLVATRDINFKEEILSCQSIDIPFKDLEKIKDTIITKYVFSFEGYGDRILLGDCSFINHSNYPNTIVLMFGCLYNPTFVFIANNDIKKGEEITIDYGNDLDFNCIE